MQQSDQEQCEFEPTYPRGQGLDSSALKLLLVTAGKPLKQQNYYVSKAADHSLS